MAVVKKSLRLVALMTAAAFWWLAGLYLYLSPKLPEAEALQDIKLQTPLRIVSADGQLIGQFGEQKRIPARYEELPETFVSALLAAEDWLLRTFRHRFLGPRARCVRARYYGQQAERWLYHHHASCAQFLPDTRSNLY